ncbi:MAG: amylo-alpha-1,6-glucosidase [Bacteroidetes bacterium]|nr:MAG: amylo-alpha-1,6-glucosidase [Bacteroidota bacterium]RLD68824.1 MAG: amylo-alpha-1,6-glucosidase [Bacteroidota bacterium]
MSYINFDKTQLINLKFSLDRELLRTNRAGSYASSTIIFTNTRKYHGLLVVPQPLIDDKNHVLLSTIDESIIENDYEYHLSMRMFPGGVYDPKGHKYLRAFESDPNPRLVYRVGGVVFTKEYIYTSREDRLLVRYTLVEASRPVTLRLKPFLAYRNVHNLSKANTYVETKYKDVANGVRWQMYQGYSHVYMQFSKKPVYVHVPDWHYNIEYIREHERGYEHTEDLFVPGYFEMGMKKGESIVISAGLEEKSPAGFNKAFKDEVKRRTPRNNYLNCLTNAADEFIVRVNRRTEIIAGFPWFGRWGRDSFVALPGLTLTVGETKEFKEVVKSMLGEMKNGLFPNLGQGDNAAYNSADASLWFFWALQQYELMTGKRNEIWKNYGKYMTGIIDNFARGTLNNIKMHDNGLLWSGEPGKAITWMDAVVNGKPVTPRSGYAVEINALWYNAVCYTLELAKGNNNKSFVAKWTDWPEKFRQSFTESFWDQQKGYLADYVTGETKDWAVRPNMLFAVSLPYSPVDQHIKSSVLNFVQQELLTPRGLRTLSPKNSAYKGTYFGNQEERDLAYHQGTVWPWLLGAFADAHFKLYGKKAKKLVKAIFDTFEEVMTEAGIGTISEVYDGDPPYKAGGAISQAWNIAELLRIKWMLDNTDIYMKYVKQKSAKGQL